jgi:hypothetical protein
MVKRTVGLLLLAACGSDTAETRPAPGEDVLCQVWAGNDIETPGQRGIPGYGSLSTDVIAAWGEPSERDGDVWIYEWSTGGRSVSATLTFEQRDLCLGGKPIGGLWLADIEASGISGKGCWLYDIRQDETTCDGCLDHGEVGMCL